MIRFEIEIEHDLTQRATEAKQNETTAASAFEESYAVGNINVRKTCTALERAVADRSYAVINNDIFNFLRDFRPRGGVFISPIIHSARTADCEGIVVLVVFPGCVIAAVALVVECGELLRSGSAADGAGKGLCAIIGRRRLGGCLAVGETNRKCSPKIKISSKLSLNYSFLQSTMR